MIGSDGAEPVPVDPASGISGVEPLLRGLIAHVYAYEELALDAAIRGGRDRVYDALLAHPLVGQADQAEGLTDRLIAENANFLSWTLGSLRCSLIVVHGRPLSRVLLWSEWPCSSRRSPRRPKIVRQFWSL